MSEELGPWIEHDGSGVPVPRGTVCHVVWLDRDEAVEPIKGSRCWKWSSYDRKGWSDETYVPIIRYRIRKPLGLTILEGLLENLPDEVPA